MEVYYCTVCSRRISDDDIKRGAAVRSADGVICSPCLALAGAAKAQVPARKASSRILKAVAASPRAAATRNRPNREEDKAPVLQLTIIIILVAASAVMFFSKREALKRQEISAAPVVAEKPSVEQHETPLEKPLEKPAEKPAPVVADSTPDLTNPAERRRREELEIGRLREEHASRELADLKEWYRSNADDSVTYKALLSPLVDTSTPAGQEAGKIVAGLVIPDPGSSVIWLSSLDVTKAQQGWAQPMNDRTVEGHTMSIGGRKFSKGFGTHSVGELFIDLKGCAESFHTSVGIDDEVSKQGSVEFVVIGDGQPRFKTNVMRGGDPAQNITVDVHGVHTLELRVTDGGDGYTCDHADWADARIIYKGQKPETIPVPK